LKKITLLIILFLLTGCSQEATDNERLVEELTNSERLIEELENNEWSCVSSRCVLNEERDSYEEYKYEYRLDDNIFVITTIFINDVGTISDVVVIDFEEQMGEGTQMIDVGIDVVITKVAYDYLSSTTTCDNEEIYCSGIITMMEIYYDKMKDYFENSDYNIGN